jgi:hypothetical protein
LILCRPGTIEHRETARGMKLGGEDGMVVLAGVFERVLDIQFAGEAGASRET